VRGTLSLCLIFVGTCFFGNQNQGTNSNLPSSSDSLSSTDPYCYRCVVSPFEACKNSVGFPHLFDRIPLLGDQVSIAVAKHWDLDQLATPDNTRAYLCLVKMAFANPGKISRDENKNPNITLLLLGYLQTKQAHDVKLGNDIESVKAYIKASTADLPGDRSR